MKINYVRACGCLLLSLLIIAVVGATAQPGSLPSVVGALCLPAIAALLYWLMPTTALPSIEFEEILEEEFEDLTHE